jgi:mono/diheme cytochrome c family protein
MHLEIRSVPNLLLRTALVLAAALVLLPGRASADAAEGEKLFKANCTACHAVNKKVIGPALKGVRQRRDDKWIINFVHNSTAVIKSGDPYAVALYKEYNNTLMTAFPQLKDEQIIGILDYIDAEANKVPAVAAAPVGGGGSIDPGLITGLAVLVGILLVVALVLLGVISLLIQAVRAKEEQKPIEAVNVFGTFKKLAGNKFVITAFTLFVVAYGSFALVKQARSVGLHQGYAPVQPIAFSHKTHAGQYGINCNYCHTGVERGKSATIPATNICMNCHNYIQEGSKYGTKELSKVVASYDNNTPIQWVRIHNLPDLVYFNHAQHVKVGGLDCASCHGDVKTMEVVYQVSDLSMGWCINCHRGNVNADPANPEGDGPKIKVDVTKNDYYIKVHNEYKGKEKMVSAAELGGLECSKCHY